MKKTILWNALFVMLVSLSACGGLGMNAKENGSNLAKAIEKGNLQAAAVLNPQLQELYNTYVTSPEKAAKVNAFLADMAIKIDKQEPGTLVKLLLLLNSNNDEMVNYGAKAGSDLFLEQVKNYAGTLEPEKVFNKIFAEY